MHYKPQSAYSFVSLPVKEGVAYAAQESWVLAASVRVSIRPFVEQLHLIRFSFAGEYPLQIDI